MSVLEGPLVFVDIETTGVSNHRHKIIEIAAIRVENGQVIREFTSLIDPQTALPPFITGLTGISNQDLVGAPTFYDIADELYDILNGAIFVAHNVRFDYGFLKQEFRAVGRQFNPKQVCTVRLSRALFPTERGHKLQNLIDRCQLQVANRHRAYDDAQAMWLFIQHIKHQFPAPSIEEAIKLQIKSPTLPRGLPATIISDLPEEAGVYIFQDDKGSPLYIGKSINIKKRVLSHFSADHSHESEFKISQQIANIEAIPTGSELSALLLESQLVKQMQPLYNRQLRRFRKLTLARQTLNDNGYISINIQDVDAIEPDEVDDILGVYTTKGKARQFLTQIIKDYGLCPKLMGLEKGRGPCFSYQLKKCSGACAGIESAEDYNLKLLNVFEGRRLEVWPYRTPIIIQEKTEGENSSSIIVDQWCVIASVSQNADCEPQFSLQDKMFDLDTYKILKSYLAAKMHKISIKPITTEQLYALAA